MCISNARFDIDPVMEFERARWQRKVIITLIPLLLQQQHEPRFYPLPSHTPYGTHGCITAMHVEISATQDYESEDGYVYLKRLRQKGMCVIRSNA